jgi:RNA polymerase sigma factor (sigma-70 family)
VVNRPALEEPFTADAMTSPLLQQVRRLVEDRRLRDVPDAELLRRFRVGRDEAAFHAVLRRHGPMVLDVCRAVLGNEADAEDAFQATFLVLAQAPGSVRKTSALAGFLYGVAYRTALKARANLARRRKHEARLPERAAPDAEGLSWGEAQRVLHEELNGLAERYRAPLVLCYLQGKTQDEAAALLRLTKGTLKRRLEQARALLRARLVRRGLGPAAVLLVSAWPAANARAVPAAVALATVKAASLAWATPGPTALLPAPAVTLAEGVLKDMLAPRIKIATAVLLVLATVGAAAAALAYQAAAVATQGQGPAAASAAEPEAGKDRPARADVFGDPLPLGARARLGTIRLRHDHPPGQLTTAFSADGKLLASGGWDDLRLWDVAAGKLLRVIRDGDRTLSYCALLFAPDGRWLAGAGRRSVCLWETGTGRRLYEFPADGQAVACSPDGKLLATAVRDGSLSVWDTTTGRQTARLRAGPSKEAPWPAFTRDGKGLVSVLGDRVYHWDLADGTLREVVEIPVPPRAGLALAPDGRAVAVLPDGGPISLRDPATGNERLTLRGGTGRRVSCFAFSRDGNTVVANETGRFEDPAEISVALWDAQTGDLRRRVLLPTRYVWGLGFTPDGRTLLTTGSEETIGLWDATTGKPTLRWPAHVEEVASVAFTPDGRSLVSGSIDRTVRLWDIATGRQRRELAGHRWRCDAIAVAPDGRAILSGGADGCVRVQDPDGKELRRLLLDGDPEKLSRPAHHVLALAVPPDGRTVTTWSCAPDQAGARPLYHLWDLATGKPLLHYPDASAVVSAPQFSPDGRLALEDVYEERAGAPAPAAGGGVGGAGQGRLVRVGVRLRDAGTGREVLTLRYPEDLAGAHALAPDGRTLVTAASRQERPGDRLRHDSALHFWELATGKERLTIPCGSAANGFQQVAYAPDGRTLATARSDNTIQFWDLIAGKELPPRVAGETQVSCLVFAPDSRSLASGHRDGTILVWDVPEAGGKQGRVGGPPDAGRLERWWDDLAGEDARRAHAAVRGLAAAPAQAVAYIRDRLRPGDEGPADQIRPLIDDLDRADFARRDAAAKRLTALGEGAGPALRAALKAGPPAEQRRRIQAILDSLDRAPSGEALRPLRAVEALELIGNDPARELLRVLARGVPDARLTREATATLKRLDRRPAGVP